MALLSARIEQFRCIELAELELDPRTTLITGLNGSGKTSLLESLYVLGRGRSFRTPRLEAAVRHGQKAARVVGAVEQGHHRFSIGVEITKGQTVARVAGETAESLAELSTRLPVQAIDPSIHKLIEEGPVRRRRYVDWGVFHVEHSYLATWQRFHRALRQRNAALRELADDTLLKAWDREFIAAGLAVTEARSHYVARLRGHLETTAAELMDFAVAVEYNRGWPDSHDLGSALAERRAIDRARGTTTAGPHRADLLIRFAGHRAKDTVSRGQQKLLAAALILGQLDFHRSEQDLMPTLLLDDPAAELDTDRLGRLLAVVARVRPQLVVSALVPARFEALGGPGRVFHVEQGRVARML